MFKTVVSRLLVIYLIVILSALVAFGIATAEMFNIQFMDDRLQTLLREAEQINEIVETKFERNRIAAREELAIIARQYNAAIWIMDLNYDTMQVVDPAHPDEWEGAQIDHIPEDIREKVLAGYNVPTRGFFGNLYDEPVLTLGRPLVLEEQVQGAIFMHVKLSDIQAQVAQIYRNVALASLFAVAFASFLIYFTAIRFSRPLVEMNVVAQRFSKGDFSVRPEIHGRDEIAQLAASIDQMADDLNDLEQMRKSFVANVSHELKSPLAAMRGFIEGMYDGTIAEKTALPGVVGSAETAAYTQDQAQAEGQQQFFHGSLLNRHAHGNAGQLAVVGFHFIELFLQGSNFFIQLFGFLDFLIGFCIGQDGLLVGDLVFQNLHIGRHFLLAFFYRFAFRNHNFAVNFFLFVIRLHPGGLFIQIQQVFFQRGIILGRLGIDLPGLSDAPVQPFFLRSV